MDAMQLIAAKLAEPKTHAVVTRYADGSERRHECRNAKAAETHAFGERRKIGKDLISHETGGIVRVIAVDIEEI